MDSRVLVVARRERLPHIESRGGIVARNTGEHTVHLVSSAATPLGGDTITVQVIVEPGAVLRLRSVAATIALPGPAIRVSRSRLELDVDGELDVDLEPMIVAGGAEHHAVVAVRIGSAGALRLRERVQVGRSGERHGYWSSATHADVECRPLLRHRVELGAGSVADDALAAPRAAVSELCFPTDPQHPGGDATVLALAAGGVLRTWQGDALPGQG
ncbi:urease accessory protein UreD [[Mycobacterium] burgundiense]|jgi:urease accessory protein|uniref:Urease accessory protein UreD n=1 Tax=[Mycobacterium] burgundiense TaxID=3064286 RepID=A0ABM9LQV1_9MYCO|nr:urease accessory protein UreD [Mycolicibacterium sp. MU0053]CAJ1503141.1 urease accessory protein UreD [Mycolicibacterium sp. MU0053]